MPIRVWIKAQVLLQYAAMIVIAHNVIIVSLGLNNYCVVTQYANLLWIKDAILISLRRMHSRQYDPQALK